MTIQPGMKFGRYTVICLSERRGPRRQKLWICECDCGQIKEVYRENLASGNSKSCGCYGLERVKVQNKTHGLCYDPIYASWVAMNGRCRSKNPHKARSYLERGISVCEEWKSFKQFYDDMQPTWKSGLWLERIDNNLGYSKENCKWSTPTEQARNKTNNRIIEFDGKHKTMSEWAQLYGIDARTLFSRLKAGWGMFDALCKPMRNWGPGRPKST